MPGSQGFLFTGCKGNCGVSSDVYGFSFKTKVAKLVVPRVAGGWYSPTGHLLYTSRDGGLYATAFDAKQLEVSGGSVAVIDGVDPLRFTMSASGTALYSADLTRALASELVWVARDGRRTPFDSTWRGRFEYPALSPDGRSLAVSVRDNTTDLWIRHADGTRQKIVTDGIVNWRSSWQADGKSLAFVSIGRLPENENLPVVYRVPADGSTKAALLQRHTFGLWEVELSRDGEWMVVRADEESNDNNIYARKMRGDTTLIPILAKRGGLTLDMALSPDTRWLCYTSLESGQAEVWVTSFPDVKTKHMVSRGGGTEPRWSSTGRELFFESGGQLMVVDVPSGPSFNPGNPKALFSLAGYHRARNRQQYDVAPDGQRFLMIKEASNAVSAGVVYVENWLPELRAKIKR